MRKSNQIPIRSLKERGRSDYEIGRIMPGGTELNIHPADVEHRDDYYVFIYQEAGNNTSVVDFQEVLIFGNAVYCIQPGQIHFGSFAEDTSAWIISVKTDWIPPEFRFFLMEHSPFRQSIPIHSSTEKMAFEEAFQLFKNFDAQADSLSIEVLKSAFDICLHLFIQVFQQGSNQNNNNNQRPILINRQFKSLLLSNFRQIKSPAEYATLLNISPSYLNEVIKETTGYPVSYWIHQEIILEAKRTLFYTDNSVKELAYALGYVDPSYFIRLFKKVTGLSPQQFRQKYRK